MYKHIGILRNLWLGDSIVYTPFLRKLRTLYPQAIITIYTGKGKVSDMFFKKIPYIDEVITVDAQANIFQKILFVIRHFKKHDLFIDTFESTKIWWFFSRMLGKISVWFSHSGYHTLNVNTDTIDPDISIIKKEFLIFEKLWHHLNFQKDDYLLDFPVDDNDRSTAAKKIWAYTMLNNPYVCIHPSSDPRYSSRKFEVSKWNEIIDYLIGKWFYVLIIGTPADAPIIEQIADRPEIIKLHDTYFSIWETWVLIEKSQLFIGINSWPARIAIAQKKPTIVINWPSLLQWEAKFDMFDNVQSVRWRYKWWDCYHHPCDLFVCKYNVWNIWLCMKNISSKQVLDAIESFL